MKVTARDRLIQAAFRVFSKGGWQATTREIAEEAGVNEVTLFRLFGSKRALLQEVIGSFVCKKRGILNEDGSVREIFESFAKNYHEGIFGSVDFIRVSLGEFSRNPDEAKAVMAGVVKPLRQQFLKILSTKQKKGEIRKNINCETLLDVFIGMLFSHVVRPSLTKVSYTTEEYHRFCIDLLIQGIE